MTTGATGAICRFHCRKSDCGTSMCPRASRMTARSPRLTVFTSTRAMSIARPGSAARTSDAAAAIVRTRATRNRVTARAFVLPAAARVDIELAREIHAIGQQRCFDCGQAAARLRRHVEAHGPRDSGQEILVRKGSDEQPAAVACHARDLDLVGPDMDVAEIGDRPLDL